MKNPISVIIRTSNSEKALGRLFARMEKKEDDEFIVVDTQSHDGTLAIAERAGARIVTNPDSFNYSRTLNLGFAAAENNWVLVLSAHCVPIRADILDCYRAAMAQVPKETAVIYGGQYWSHPQYEKANKEIRIFGGSHGDAVVLKGSNANALYAREAWSKQPFDETLPTGEDNEWLARAKRAGLILAAAPAAAVFYLHQRGPLYRFTKAWNETLAGDAESAPMSVTGLFQGIAQATRRLLWEARAPRPWVGQIAHQLGSFLAGRSAGKRR